MLETRNNIDKAWIEAHIPHQGTMCLLDKVTSWNEEEITCHASSHHLPNNPLRYQDQLSTACGIEYAAQAMAVHGALLATSLNAHNGPPRAGFLVSVRGATVHRARLDDIKHPLEIKATCSHRAGDNILYKFSLHAANELLLEGRAAVMLNADKVLESAK
ncbi:MAG: 3-hydroxylacyl-ACP dehydratase [Methylophilaceae bacterium]